MDLGNQSLKPVGGSPCCRGPLLTNLFGIIRDFPGVRLGFGQLLLRISSRFVDGPRHVGSCIRDVQKLGLRSGGGFRTIDRDLFDVTAQLQFVDMTTNLTQQVVI